MKFEYGHVKKSELWFATKERLLSACKTLKVIKSSLMKIYEKNLGKRRNNKWFCIKASLVLQLLHSRTLRVLVHIFMLFERDIVNIILVICIKGIISSIKISRCQGFHTSETKRTDIENDGNLMLNYSVFSENPRL